MTGYIDYASYFISYLLSNLDDTKNINRIVLFGSAAKGEANKESDIDLFLELKKQSAVFESEVKKIEKKFYSSREAALFKTKGIGNIFSGIVAIFDDINFFAFKFRNNGLNSGAALANTRADRINILLIGPNSDFRA